MNRETLLEIKRSEYALQSKLSDLYLDLLFGKNRYFRRMRQAVQKSTQLLNRLDTNKLFKLGILDINLQVLGETDVYMVRISFGHFLAELHKLVLKNEDNFSLRVVTQALTRAMNADDVLVRCSCPDFGYRIAYLLSMHGGIAGEMETRPSDETNPEDSKGRSCKHINAVLTNNSWLQRVARVIFNYVNYMKEHYQSTYSNIIYPAIYEKDYDEIYQQSLDIYSKDTGLDLNENGDAETIDVTNKWAREKDKFLPGNQSGMLFAKLDDTDDLMSLNLYPNSHKEFDVDSIDLGDLEYNQPEQNNIV